MSGDSKSDLDDLRGMLGIAATDTPKPTPFAESMALALTQALAFLRDEGMIEVEAENLAALTTQVVEVGLESASMKNLPLRIVKTLMHSDFVEEVYGTDAEISSALRRILERI